MYNSKRQTLEILVLSLQNCRSIITNKRKKKKKKNSRIYRGNKGLRDDAKMLINIHGFCWLLIERKLNLEDILFDLTVKSTKGSFLCVNLHLWAWNLSKRMTRLIKNVSWGFVLFQRGQAAHPTWIILNEISLTLLVSRYGLGKSQTFFQSMCFTYLFQYGTTYGSVIISDLNRDLISLLFFPLFQDKQLIPTEVSVVDNKADCRVPTLGWALYNRQIPEEIAPKTSA